MSATTQYIQWPETSTGGGGSGTGFTAVGTATLVNGTVTVNSALVTSSSKIFFSYRSLSGVPGILYLGSISSGANFVVSSSSDNDNSDIQWGFV